MHSGTIPGWSRTWKKESGAATPKLDIRDRRGGCPSLLPLCPSDLSASDIYLGRFLFSIQSKRLLLAHFAAVAASKKVNK
jgi:hypothetical protein